MRRIAIEEAFVTSEIVAEWKKILKSGKCEPGFRKMGETIFAENPGNSVLHARLLDIGPSRIAHMDSVGIAMQVLSMTSPGVQVFDPALASRLASDANDALAQAICSHPDRFAGLGAVAPQDPAAAAREIERVRSLGLHGLIINSHTFGEYLDLPKYRPIFEAAQAADLPIYLHPREPGPSLVAPFLDYGLYFAGWGFAVETGLHAMRLIMSGTFERFPKLKIILGHMGEGIPFWLQRIDNRYLLQVKIGAVEKLPRLPSEYFLDNFVITTAGVTSMPALRLSLDVLGVDRILFAADYPYEDDAEAVGFLDKADISTEERERIAWRNAAGLFKLDIGPC
ncbi:amidohydrolase family protein [Rhizorhabdus dicambivorans]|uniref:Amidohydrolase n=1 Tax=Rhizorhabdus dicambivorans TaxID=1850238 RepID=A0A2A4FQ90_9SPHN|nr:amidohydrolase family protein [Rhizorhabdus dicambivorans]ATE67359.1 amidohydrolase [Rhizorhabdus dicambivorans]PCE39884.1 amidohydrolase [Rhizorhabdus dicambivorans]